jgi:hypothetical protein
VRLGGYNNLYLTLSDCGVGLTELLASEDLNNKPSLGLAVDSRKLGGYS